MHIEKALPGQADVLTAIAAAAKKSWGYPDSWMEHWRETLTITPAAIRSSPTFCAMEDDLILGFYLLAIRGAEAWLDHLWIRPERMKGGVGRALVSHASDQARALGFPALWVESDPNAAGFYRRLGAESVRFNAGEMEGIRRELPVMKLELS